MQLISIIFRDAYLVRIIQLTVHIFDKKQVKNVSVEMELKEFINQNKIFEKFT